MKKIFLTFNKNLQSNVDRRLATQDDDAIALIIYDNPKDVTTAMKLYKDSTRNNLYEFDEYKLYFILRNDHVIKLNRSFVKTIPKKIEQAFDDIKNIVCIVLYDGKNDVTIVSIHRREM